MPKVRTKTTITVVNEVPFNSDYYPSDVAETLAEAVEYERSLEESDIVTMFVENLSLDYSDDEGQNFMMSHHVEALDDHGNVLDDETVATLSDPPEAM